MYSINIRGSRAAWARGFMALVNIMLATGLALMVSPAEAAPFAYVANEGSNTVSVIDTATNTVLTGTGFPIMVGSAPFGVAVTPDGKHAYVTNGVFPLGGSIQVIDTASNTVVATVSGLGGVSPGR